MWYDYDLRKREIADPTGPGLAFFVPRSTEPPRVIRYLMIEDLPKPINYSHRHVMRLVRAGKLPPPVRIGNRKAWPETTIADFLARLPLDDATNRPRFTSEEARAAVNARWAKYRARKTAGVA